MNYRSNIFGFPNAPGLKQQNLGLLDQRLAMEWARDNIARFGGDPERIVLWGRSAGSKSVDHYAFKYHDDPIVSGVILDSATVFTPLNSQDYSQSNFTFVAENVGCAGYDSDATARLECMRTVDAQTIEGFLAQWALGGHSPALSFSTVVDDQDVFSNYTQRTIDGRIARLPTIIGTNKDDSVTLTKYSPEGPTLESAFQTTLGLFFCPATYFAYLRESAGIPVYRYRYSGNFTNLSPNLGSVPFTVPNCQ